MLCIVYRKKINQKVYILYLESMVGQRFEAGQAIPAVWKARMGRHWLVVNEDAQSIHLVDDSPRCTLEAYGSCITG